MDITFDLAATGFSATNARACMALSRLAYDDPPDIVCAATDTQVIIRDCGKALGIGFRGTTNLRDFIMDAKAWHRRSDVYGFHTGIYEALASVFEPLQNHILALPPKPMFITGHSLGGGEAMLFAFRWIMPGAPIQGVYTFGQPRIGNRAFAAAYNRDYRDRTFRFVNGEDIVPRLPGWLMGYHHAGLEEFFTAEGPLIQNPSLGRKLISDGVGTYHDCTQGKLAQAADHHLIQYAYKVDAI
ncbi:MAG: lipase, class 3 [Pedosphaera sp.]|nr:lipase, class 3 [Pedosphaera sp.]